MTDPGLFQAYCAFLLLLDGLSPFSVMDSTSPMILTDYLSEWFVVERGASKSHTWCVGIRVILWISSCIIYTFRCFAVGGIDTCNIYIFLMALALTTIYRSFLSLYNFWSRVDFLCLLQLMHLFHPFTLHLWVFFKATWVFGISMYLGHIILVIQPLCAIYLENLIYL